MTAARLVGATLMGAGSVAVLVVLGACNAIVGNGDIRFSTDSGKDDATVVADADAARDGGAPDGAARQDDSGGDDASDAVVDAATADGAACEGGLKQCGPTCALLDDSVYGCGPTRCTPCELPNANAGCAPSDGGALACSVASCKKNHGDCNGEPLDGCEVDLSADLYNCGACGHDCSNLPHVAGNVSCVDGVCSFDESACAPGYGICTTNPDDGCDTDISVPAHCGRCASPCGNAGFPYCSPTGASPPFACTSGCATGLALCGTSCVDEKSDPNHCGGCGAQCPAIAGGTPTCSGAGACGFSCNANDHVCGAGGASFCAANNDPNHCGLGGECGQCPAPPNATAVCAGGTTCDFACNSNAHACGSACVIDSDPNNCGMLCATNCPGPLPGSGAGVAACDGNACSITCANGSTLCGGTVCVNEQTDSANCGGCGNACLSGQICAAAACVCNAPCPNGCCDATGACQSAVCGSAGGVCASGCPAAIPEARGLALWLVGDELASGSSTWLDQSGRHADATCTPGSCPESVMAPPIGHRAAAFTGGSFFALGDPAMQYATQAWTIFVVASPDAGAATNANLIDFWDGAGNDVSLLRSGSGGDLLFQVLPGSATNALTGTGAWRGAWEVIVANVDATGNGALTVVTPAAAGSPIAGMIGAPAAVDRGSAYLGIDASQTLPYTGQVAEVVIYASDLSPASGAAVQSYLANRYGL